MSKAPVTISCGLACVLLLLASCSQYGSAVVFTPTVDADDSSVVEVSLHAAPQIVAPHGGEVSVDVPFENPSDTLPLELKLKSKSCECAEHALDRSRIEPGGEGVMTIKAKVGDASTLRNLDLVFETGLEQPRELRFVVDVQTCPVIEFTPNVSPLLAIPFGKSGQFEFDVFVHQFESSAEVEPAFSIDSKEATLAQTEKQGILYEGVRRRVWHCVASIKVPPREDFVEATNMQTATVNVQVGEHLGQVRVLWRPQNLIQSRPETLLVNGRQAGMFEKTFVLEADTPFRLLAIEPENPQLKIAATLGESQTRHELRASLEVSPDHGMPRKSWIIATTDHPEEPTVKIPVYIFE